MSTYEDALIFAVKAHDGQTRWNGDPYITHPIRVARRVAEDLVGKFTQTYIDVAKTVAVLHDVLEDTDADRQTLADKFGEDITAAVEIVTKPEDIPLSYHGFIERIAGSGNEMAIRVKLADLSDNLSDLNEGHGLRKRYESALVRLKKAMSDSGYSS